MPPLSILSVLALGAAAVPAVRLLARPAIRRELSSRPIAAAMLALAAGGVVVALLQLGRRGSPALLACAAAAGALALAASARARPGFGRSRGLPPGSLGLAASLDAIEAPRFYADAARRWGPVFKMAQFHRPVACIVDLPRGLALLDAERESLAQPPLPFGGLSPGGYIEFMDGAQHARYRGILQSALGGRVIAACRADVEALVLQELVAMSRQGGPVDPQPFLERIAFGSLARVMYGLPAGDARVGELARLFADLGAARAFAERRPDHHRAVFARITGFLRSLGSDLAARGAAAAADPPSVLGEIVRADPALVDDETLIANLALVVHVTRNNVRGLLAWVLKEHCDPPGWAASHPRVGVDALATSFVNETLRRHQAEYFYREVVREIRLGPYRIPKGWLVRVCVRECHDDPAVFPDPTTFDPGRFIGRTFARTEYCPFGEGLHACFGAGLAVMIARAFALAVAVRCEARASADGRPERAGNRHWSHWQPSARLRVEVRVRGDRELDGPGSLQHALP